MKMCFSSTSQSLYFKEALYDDNYLSTYSSHDVENVISTENALF